MIRPIFISALFAALALGLSLSATAQLNTQSIQKRLSGVGEAPAVMEGLEINVFAKNLGDIRALTVEPSGDVFAAEYTRGEILRLRDRGRDGVMDIKASYLRGFDRPSGLAASKTTLYIADAKGIWSAPITRGLTDGRKTLLADLSKVKTRADHRPLTLSVDGLTLYVGLGALDAAPVPAASLIAINTQTGRAALYASDMPQTKAVAASQSGRVFALVETKAKYDFFTQVLDGRDDVSKAPLLQLPVARVPTGFIMPWDTAYIKYWPETLKNHVLISFGGGVHQIDAVDLADVSFGSAKAAPQTVVSGFGDGRSAWGRPSAMVLDKGAGLLIADNWSGSLWRLTGAEPKPDTIEPVIEIQPKDDSEPKPKSEELDSEEKDEPPVRKFTIPAPL